MNVTMIEVSFGRTKNLGDFSSARADCKLIASVDEDDDLDVALENLNAMARPGTSWQRPPSAQDIATPAQIRLIYKLGFDVREWTESTVERVCQEKYGGAMPDQLTKRQASAYIDWLKSGAAV